MTSGSKYIRHFSEIGLADIALVGGKNASLGELYRELVPQGIPVPNGFAITAAAFRQVLDEANAWPELQRLMAEVRVDDVAGLAARAAAARELIYAAPLPVELVEEILDAYRALRFEYDEEVTLAVRSSATAEDLPSASFAGQHESYLNVKGEAPLIDAVQRCFASLYTDRAIRYRIDRGFDHSKVLLSTGVMKMVRADLAASGVTFSLDTESGFRDVVYVTGSWGLGEPVVQGTVEPDEFFVFKPTLEQGRRAVLRRTLGAKKMKLVYAHGGRRDTTRALVTARDERERFCITDAEVLTLADYTAAIERHYSSKAGQPTPMDVEWAKDGLDGKLYVVQARPETVISQRPLALLTQYTLTQPGQELLTGRAVGSGIASGNVRIVRDAADLVAFRPGEVLVADATSPDWGAVMKSAAALVTNRGGRTCHAAIVARELGIPAIVGSGSATATLKDGASVTVSCAEGAQGRVYDGTVAFTTETIDLSHTPRPNTRMMVNLGDPDMAFQASFLPADGVGLARMEFIISNHIQIHPMALAHPERVEDAAVRAQIERVTRAYGAPADFFVERLSEGIGTIAAAFYPRPVIVRLSDFKSNEYASLLGGKWFEPAEENPMLGFRGASRYTHPAYADGFALECAALKRARDSMGLTNIRIMIPFCRRVDEAEKVVAKMAELGLVRGAAGLEIYLMCEIPNNIVQIDAFARHCDGFSIGSNDLTQLVLGVDRDSALVAFDYDERDPGVLEMIRQAVAGAHRNGRHIGICGQAPSDYPEYAAFLVQTGIDSISLNLDSLLPTLAHVAALEHTLAAATQQTPAAAKV